MQDAEQYGHTQHLSDIDTPEAQLLSDEIKHAVSVHHRHSCRLTGEAISLRELEGLSYEEIAEGHGLPDRDRALAYLPRPRGDRPGVEAAAMTKASFQPAQQVSYGLAGTFPVNSVFRWWLQCLCGCCPREGELMSYEMLSKALDGECSPEDLDRLLGDMEPGPRTQARLEPPLRGQRCRPWAPPIGPANRSASAPE